MSKTIVVTIKCLKTNCVCCVHEIKNKKIKTNVFIRIIFRCTQSSHKLKMNAIE